MLSEQDQELIAAAGEAIRRRYRNDWQEVGAAMRTRNGRIFTGVNLDAYVGRMAVCAEAVAIGRAVTDVGEAGIDTIVAVRHPKPDDPDQRLASPLENYTRRGQAADARWLTRLVQAERIAGFVVGLPVHTSGDESQKSREARQFGDWVAKTTSLPIEFFDERYTTAHAEALLLDADLTKKRRKQRLDKLAAQILLAAYLESSRESASQKALDDKRL